MLYFWLINLVLMLISPSTYAQLMLQRTLALNPPPGDLSVVFLSQLFGSVDGVLGGSGSQIFGQMMSIFNGAILALGSIFVFYTVVVGTLNTAHEGEFLGRQWSSIWLPVRSVLGISILSPGLSGFSLIQVFVMWVVVQGVGAADKVWNSALDYLNQGGTIYKTQQAFTNSQRTGEIDSKGSPTFKGAATILAGQVCMLTVQNLLEQLRQSIIKASNSPCKASPVLDKWKTVCFTPVPDFLMTFNPVSEQEKSTKQFLNPQKEESNPKKPEEAVLSMPMPSFSSNTPGYTFFEVFNGVCGTVKWKPLNNTNIGTNQSELNINGINRSQFETLLNSRAIAIQTMFDFLETTARAMVSNSPLITDENLKNQDCAVKLNRNPPNCFAKQQYGYPFNSSGLICTERNADCKLWSSLIDPTARSTMSSLLSGREFTNAIAAYDGVMTPILVLQKQMGDMNNFKALRSFIWDAKTKGWILAGTYFFELIRISNKASSNETTSDKDSGLDGSIFYGSGDKVLPKNCDPSDNQGICSMVNFLRNSIDLDKLGLLDLIISGNSVISPNLNICPSYERFNLDSFDAQKGYVKPYARLASSVACTTNVLGFIGNSYYIVIPGDILPPVDMKVPALDTPYKTPPWIRLEPPDFSACLGKWWFAFGACIGRAIMKGIAWALLNLIQALQWVVMQFLPAIWIGLVITPLKIYMFPMIFSILKEFTTHAIDKDLNPIVVLGHLGGFIIQKTIQAYWSLAPIILLGALPVIGNLVSIVTAFVLPLFFGWLALFLYLGFTIAYYVPLLPYIIFLFGSIGWMMAVIESMVAAPILALGVMSPEGEGLSGKSERGFLILVNVFLRPAMMIIGYIIAIALCYIVVHMLIYGFIRGTIILSVDPTENNPFAGVDWYGFMLTRVFARGFSIFIFVSLYAAMVQKCFTLIFMLPDKVMRWIGGGPESFGSDAEKWVEELKGSVEKFAEETDKGMAAGSTKMMLKIGDVSKRVGASVGGYVARKFGGSKKSSGDASAKGKSGDGEK